MISLIPGSNGHISNGPLSSVSEPKTSQRTGTYKHTGRKFLKSAGQASEKERTFHSNATIEEIDKMLEDDAFALLHIKKEITNSQKEELEKLRRAVLEIKKEYDTIFIQNNMLDKEVSTYTVKITTLQQVDRDSNHTNHAMKELVQNLQERDAEVLEELSAEQRTIKMLSLMIKRYDDEMAECRLETAKATTVVEHAKHDLQVTENSLQVNKQELAEQEIQLEKLNQTLKSRQDQREGKIHMLHTLSEDGELAVARLQQSLAESDKQRVQTARSKSRATSSEKKNSPRNASQDEAEFDELAEPASSPRRLTVPQARELVQRYQTQASRMEKLQALDADLKANIAEQVKKKKELSEQLHSTQFKIQTLASSRQIYQEVDLQDSALASASKQCEDCRERDFRLRLNMESLRASVPRFLTKVTKIVHPKPTESQLGDAILKLEDELTKLIKVIGSALLKDATPDDLAIMSQQSAAGGQGDAHSEFARLQRLPGYNRMKRQLFFNLMTAKPDVSDQNIRVEHSQKMRKHKHSQGTNANAAVPTPAHALGGSPSPRKKGVQVQMADSVEDPEETDIKHFTEGSSLDRTTIKSISKLIYERDQAKLEAAKKAAAPKSLW